MFNINPYFHRTHLELKVKWAFSVWLIKQNCRNNDCFPQTEWCSYVLHGKQDEKKILFIKIQKMIFWSAYWKIWWITQERDKHSQRTPGFSWRTRANMTLKLSPSGPQSISKQEHEEPLQCSVCKLHFLSAGDAAGRNERVFLSSTLQSRS